MFLDLYINMLLTTMFKRHVDTRVCFYSYSFSIFEFATVFHNTVVGDKVALFLLLIQ
jgi:hypothetical protein